MRLVRSSLVSLPMWVVSLATSAQITCPPMPAAVTSADRDVKLSINAAAGALAKVKAIDIGMTTEVSANSLFDKHPNADKLLVMQMLASTYCSMLTKSPELSSAEKLENWSKFQDRMLNYAVPTVASSSATAELQMFQSALQPLYFRIGTAELVPESRDRLADYAERLKGLAFSGLIVEGHTQPVEVSPNMNISSARAAAVAAYLRSVGIDGKKMRVAAVGGREPIQAANSGYSNRVVLRIIP